MRVAPCRHLPPEFVAAQRLREASNLMLQVPPPTPKQHMARSRTLGDDGGKLPAAGSLPADAAAAGCGGGGWTAAGSLWSLLRRGGNAGRGGAGGGGAGGAAAPGAAAPAARRPRARRGAGRQTARRTPQALAQTLVRGLLRARALRRAPRRCASREGSCT